MHTSGKRRKKTGEERGYRHLLDSDKWTEISIGEWNHHWTSRVSLARSGQRAYDRALPSLSRPVCAPFARVYSGTHLNLSRWLTERPTTVHLCVLYSLTSSSARIDGIRRAFRTRSWTFPYKVFLTDPCAFDLKIQII